MLRSLSSAISGLKNFQTKMDVIGNNIANSETSGFKKSTVSFQDTLYQTLNGASAPTDERGGTNGASVGLGMTIASITVDQSQTSNYATNSVTDMAIDGNGYFILDKGGTQVYTRNGNFEFDAAGNLKNPEGLIVQGWLADPADEYNIKTNGAIANINIANFQTIPALATTKVNVSGNLDSDIDVNCFYDTSNPNLPVMRNFDPNNDHPEEANTVITSRVVYDSLGNEYTVYMRYYKAATDVTPANWDTGTTPPTKTTDDIVNNSEWFCDISLDPTFTGSIDVYSPTTTSTVGADVVRLTGLDFTTGGVLDTTKVTDVNLIINAAAAGADDIDFKIDFAGLTQYNTDSKVTSIQDGYSAGNLISKTVDSSGVISGTFDNGLIVTLAQVSLADFQNPSGLAQAGGTLFLESNNSGEPIIGSPGSGGKGSIMASCLEMSNVDIAQEFTDMIVTQRAFQSASRIITTSDQMLEELVNLKR